MIKRVCFVTFIAAIALLLAAPFVSAVSQWSRKYDQPCSYCHTSFPRLNLTGEKFQLNGYQMIDTQDGDEAGKKELNEKTFVGKVEDWFGAEANVTALRFQQNGITVNGESKMRWDVGEPSWLQIFTAGSIFKNASVYIDTEFNKDDKVRNNWFRVGIHNIMGSSLANMYVGTVDPMEFASVAGRLRVIPNINNYALQNVFSSSNLGEDSVPLAKALPGITWFGWNEKIVYAAGIGNGAKFVDANRNKNLWGTVKYYRPSGTNLSLHAQYGVDTLDTDVAQKKNSFYRFVPGFNYRHEDWDILAAYVYGHDDNYFLGDVDQEAEWHGATMAVATFLNPESYIVVQWDYVTSDDDPSIEYNVLSPTYWYQPRENFKVGFTPQFDLRGTDDLYHPHRNTSLAVVLRAMI